MGHGFTRIIADLLIQNKNQRLSA